MERNLFAAENSWNCGDKRKTRRRALPGDCWCLCTSVFIRLCECIYVCIYIYIAICAHTSVSTHAACFYFEVSVVSRPNEMLQG